MYNKKKFWIKIGIGAICVFTFFSSFFGEKMNPAMAILYFGIGLFLIYSALKNDSDIKLSEEEKMERKKEYNEKLNLLKEQCEKQPNSMAKIYLIKNSKITPYDSYAKKIIKKVGNVNLRMEKTTMLLNEGFLTNDDFNELIPIFKDDYDKSVERLKAQAQAKSYQTSSNINQQQIKRSKKYNYIQCPNCGSSHIQIMDNKTMKTTLNMNPLKPFTVYNHKEVKKTKKKVSKGKLIAGVATGGASLLVTGARKKVDVDSYFCMDCGCQWEE